MSSWDKHIVADWLTLPRYSLSTHQRAESTGRNGRVNTGRLVGLQACDSWLGHVGMVLVKSWGL